MTPPIKRGLNPGLRGIRGPAGITLAVIAGWVAACGPSDPGIVDLDSAADTLHAPDTAAEDSVTATDDWTAPPLRAVVSDPVAAGSVGALAGSTGFWSPARAIGEDLVYVSLPPGSLDGGTQVVVANRESGLLETITLIDGGFDPVALRGSAGDTLEFNAFRGSTEIVEWWEVVPVSSPPVVVRSNPGRGKRDVPVALSPFIVFSEPMDPATLDAATIRLFLNGVVVPGRVEITADLLGVTFTPDQAFVPNSVYVLNVASEAGDLDGQDLEAGHDVVFITESASGLPPCALPSGCGRIVFVSARDGNPEIYSVNADGTGLARLTNDAAVDDQPAWSPDGQRIAFVSNRGGGFELYVMNADGSNVVNRSSSAIYNQRVPSRSSGSQHPSWSPDGTKIVYSALSDLNLDLWITSADAGGPSPTLLYQGPDSLSWEEQPAWSPDGTRIAFVSDWLNYSIVYDVFLINTDGSGLTMLTRPADREHGNLSWSPDATRIAFTHAEWAGTERVLRVGVMGADGTGLVLLAAAWWGNTAWSPDGQMIAFTAGVAGAKSIAWTMADGSGSGILVADGWSPDWR